MSKMTENDIILYWKHNGAERRAFQAIPIECRDWLNDHPVAQRLTDAGAWRDVGAINMICDHAAVYKIPADYQPAPAPKKGRWVPYDVDREGAVRDEFGNQIGYFDDYKQIAGIFGGWWLEHGGAVGWSARPMGVNDKGEITEYADAWQYPLVPTKIRFWVVK